MCHRNDHDRGGVEGCYRVKYENYTNVDEWKRITNGLNGKRNKSKR